MVAGSSSFHRQATLVRGRQERTVGFLFLGIILLIPQWGPRTIGVVSSYNQTLHPEEHKSVASVTARRSEKFHRGENGRAVSLSQVNAQHPWDGERGSFPSYECCFSEVQKFRFSEAERFSVSSREDQVFAVSREGSMMFGESTLFWNSSSSSGPAHKKREALVGTIASSEN